MACSKKIIRHVAVAVTVTVAVAPLSSQNYIGLDLRLLDGDSNGDGNGDGDNDIMRLGGQSDMGFERQRGIGNKDPCIQRGRTTLTRLVGLIIKEPIIYKDGPFVSGLQLIYKWSIFTDKWEH